MGSNKTRCFSSDNNGQPLMGGVYEFDVYSEANDYAKAWVRYAYTTHASTVYYYVLSYDNKSYRWSADGSGVSATEIAFP